MKRKLVIVLAVVVAALVAWGLARALPLSDEEERRMRSMNVFITAGVPERLEDPEKLPNWRAISDDLGVLLRQDERFGYRGRLFVKAGDTWEAVAIDGIDSFGYVPLKR